MLTLGSPGLPAPKGDQEVVPAVIAIRIVKLSYGIRTRVHDKILRACRLTDEATDEWIEKPQGHRMQRESIECARTEEILERGSHDSILKSSARIDDVADVSGAAPSVIII